MTTILVVDDEETFRDTLSFSLRQDGFKVFTACDGNKALEVFARQKIDLVLLDLMMPGMSGTEVCKQLRQESNVPIIMVTAKDEVVDKVVGLELGADDYLPKPYSYRELLARIRAVLRRGQSAETAEDDSIIQVGQIRMDVARHQVTSNGEEITLALREFELLEYLLRHPGRVLTRAQLLDRVWGSVYLGDSKTLDVHIKRLRNKLEADPSNPTLITTVRGLGYRLNA
ncbi:DNA-binding response regulator [Boudabousia tangfeifanii]|uniref:Sensory transduction protein RegX3 n=1 Tax=Boudabousia tangfeifanii TaxID=1912795 RepID=A0A1D9MM68_9ACTO|nr:response regulator transcription factor [Boudabousia tangfeifanii]AOZ73289.1 DNA-binding response regulator [Boudabousia tangfeifanii]